MAVRDLRLGRIYLPTTFSDLTEQLGDTLDVAGAALTDGERRPRAFPLTLPVHGTNDESNAYLSGEKMRRQVRALVDNQIAKQYGIYFNFTSDTDLNGWLRIGGGDLAYAEGGHTLSEYQLQLSDVYRVGSPRTHRQARRLLLFDKRAGTYPRDILGTIFNTDFGGLAQSIFMPLPVGVLGVNGRGRSALTPSTLRAGKEGVTPQVDNRVDGEVVIFDQALDADKYKNDVVVLDRRGFTNPTLTAPGDLTPEATYGWEEVPGPNYPLTFGDLPVIENGHCRVRYVWGGIGAIPHLFKLDRWVAGTGYVEVAAVNFNAASTQSLRDVNLEEVSTERVVLRFCLDSIASGGNRYDECFVILQRGWMMPRIEMYVRAIAGSVLRLEMAESGTITVTRFGGFSATSASWAWANQTPLTSDGPWWQLAGSTHTISGAFSHIDTIAPYTDAVVYGSNRYGISTVAKGGLIVPWHCLALHVPQGSGGAGNALDFSRANMHDQFAIPDLVPR